MRRRRAAAVGAATIAAAAACGGGGGPLPGNSFGREAPPPTREAPPSTREDPTGACVQCDVRYTCVDVTGQGPSFALQLSTQARTCSDASIAYYCSGIPFGATSCSVVGAGAFTCGNYVCSP
jgi:hypothetical protein